MRKGITRLFDIVLEGISNKYECEELIKVFLKPGDYQLSFKDGAERDKKEILREIYGKLSGLTGKRPEWGTLTGVRPVKLAGEFLEKYGDLNQVTKILTDEYLLSREKADLLISIYMYQRERLDKPERNRISLYIGIPFCPSRCLYCSFTSNRASDSRIGEYMDALLKETVFAGIEMKKAGLTPETIYIGGGTPTALAPQQLERLLACVEESFDLTALREYTVEAGRPDTITTEKIRLMKNAGVSRISINPQTMHEKTLALIGRSHSRDDVFKAFSIAREAGFRYINMDVIAGLPEERPEDFEETVRIVTALCPENVTIHTLAVKRASILIETDRDYHYEHGETVKEMLRRGKEILAGAGFLPYYLYRQKHMAGNFENIGWCKRGTEGIYNIRIMEEKQTVAALGAGGISKVYYPEKNRLERVPNVTNYEHYISRIDEMMDRKRENMFAEGKKDADKRA